MEQNHADDTILRQTYQARDDAWKRVGVLDDKVLAHMINPSFTGEPEWPDLRRAFKVVHLKNGNTIIATDGLSDPFVKDHMFHKVGVNGFGLELYIEITEPFQFNKAGTSWWWNALNQAALQVAYYGNVREFLEQNGGTMTTELYDVPIPSQYTSDGRVPVIIGVPSKVVPEEITGPLSSIQLVSVVLLSLKELKAVASGKKEDRERVTSRIIGDYGEPLSILGRS